MLTKGKKKLINYTPQKVEFFKKEWMQQLSTTIKVTMIKVMKTHEASSYGPKSPTPKS